MRRRQNNGETKTILNISGGTVCKLPGSQSDYQGKSGNLTNLINSLCVKPELSIHTWKLYHLFSILLIILQLIILRKNFKLEHILQIPVSIIFGYFIDLTMILFPGSIRKYIS